MYMDKQMRALARALGWSYYVALLLFALTMRRIPLLIAMVGIVFWAKLLLRCPRPPSSTHSREPFRGPDVFSMPSGHAVFGAAVAHLAQHPAGVAYGCMLAFSRAWIGVHSWMDVLVGFQLGTAMILFVPPWIWGTRLLLMCSMSGCLLYVMDIRSLPPTPPAVKDMLAQGKGRLLKEGRRYGQDMHDFLTSLELF